MKFYYGNSIIEEILDYKIFMLLIFTYFEQLIIIKAYEKGNFNKHLNLRNPIITGVVVKISIINNPIQHNDRKQSNDTSLNPIRD